MSVINTGSFGRFLPVSWTITHCFGVREWFPRLTNPGMRLRLGHQQWQFWPILARFMDYYSLFLGPEVISMINKPWDVFTRRSSILLVLADSGLFHRYYSLFWGPRVITMINKPWNASTCRSSTLIVLADSGPFHGLLVTVLGSQSDFHD